LWHELYVIDEVDELKQEVKEMRAELKDLDKRVIVLETKIAGPKK
jgi:phage shock protein A